MIEIELNGERRQVAQGTTLAVLVAGLGANPKGMAVERNLEIVPKSLYAETELHAGDRLEIVQFVGGG